MINKIKDFLKNRWPVKRSQDFSDQESEMMSDSDKTHSQPLSQDLSESTTPTGLEAWRGRLKNIKLPEWKKPDFGKSGGGPSLSPNISRLSEKFLSRSSRETIHQVGLVLLICSVTYSLGKLSALFLKGKAQVEPSRRYSVNLPFDREFQVGTLAQVKSINIFRTNTGVGKKKQADTKCEEAQGNSNLPIKLVNTIVLQDTVKSLASVQVRGTRELQEVRVGDQIENLAKIFKITRLELLVKNLESGACESIASDAGRNERPSPIGVMSPSQSKAFIANKKINGIENKGNKFVIQKTLLDEKLKDIGQILTQARAVKIQNPDGSLSFKMTEMDPEGIFPYLGLQDGDIITSINGKPIYDMNEVMTLFARIKNLDKLQLGLRREGSESTQEYSINK